MNNDTCGRTTDSSSHVHGYAFFVYNVAAPIFAVLALFGQTLLMFVLIKRFKTEQMYAYQVYCASAEAVAVVIKILYFLSIQTDPAVMGVYQTPFQESLSRCYACVWFNARLARPLAASICTLCLLLSTVMAADRVVALLKPMAHKRANHKVWQRASLAGCVILSFSASAFDIKKVYVVTDADGTYASSVDTAYVNQTIYQVLAFLRIFLQAFGLVCLSVLSIALCYLYRTRVLNLKAKISGKAAQEEAKRVENTLITLTLFQCLHSVLYMSLGLSATAFSSCAPSLYACWREYTSTSIDLARMIIDVANFYGVLIVSKKVRRVVKTAFSCWKNDVSTNRVVELKMGAAK